MVYIYSSVIPSSICTPPSRPELMDSLASVSALRNKLFLIFLDAGIKYVAKFPYQISVCMSKCHCHVPSRVSPNRHPPVPARRPIPQVNHSISPDKNTYPSDSRRHPSAPVQVIRLGMTSSTCEARPCYRLEEVRPFG